MRQGQHYNKNRTRGRNRRPNNNNGGNPANKVYDSNGPDVRVRGNAQTVADKYQQLARDAHTAGEWVRAESYYQHAEHYLRIVAVAQAQREAKQAEREKQQAEREKQQAERARQQAERAKANEEKAAREQEQEQADDTPEQNEQVEASEEAASKPKRKKPAGKPKKRKSDNGTSSHDDGWEGPKPDFLKSDDIAAEKPVVEAQVETTEKVSDRAS